MSKTVVVGTETFELPEQGANADYAEELTDFFVAVADALTTVQGPADIIVTSAVINNNVSSPTVIPGFTFSSSQVLSFVAEATVTRSTASPSVSLVETFELSGNWNGSDWTMTVESVTSNESGVDLDINTSGDIVYTSSNLPGTSYVGQITFKAKSIIQP